MNIPKGHHVNSQGFQAVAGMPQAKCKHYTLSRLKKGFATKLVKIWSFHKVLFVRKGIFDPKFMMKQLLILAFLLMPGILPAQQQKDSVSAATTHPAYYYYTGIPPFQTTLVNGKSFSDKDLIKGRPVIMFLFLPDCGYCHKEMEWITAAMSGFSDVQILMITDQSMADMAGYYQQAGFSKYSNIKMGRQENRGLIGFYGLKYYPGIFVYDKNHQIVYHHEGTVPVDTLLHYLNK